MTQRITRKDAERALDAYCAEAGLPRGHYLTQRSPNLDTTPYLTTVPGTDHRVALLSEGPGYRCYVIIGGYAISGAYGGYEVQEIDGKPFPGQGPGPCTGVRTPFGMGHRTAREIVAQLDAARYAVADMKERAR